MATAFDGACKSLGLTGRTDPAKETVAKRTIELARTGLCDPEQLQAELLATFKRQRQDGRG